MLRGFLHSADGQASLDFTAVVLLVAISFAVGAAAVADGGVTNGVVRGFQRALCIVTGDDCRATKLSACTTRTVDTKGSIGAEVGFLRLGADVAVAVEERSDGSVEVTLLEGGSSGAGTKLGAEARVQVGRRSFGGAVSSTAEVMARYGRRRSWSVGDRAAADRLVERIVASAAPRTASSLPLVGGVARRLAGAVGADTRPLPRPDAEGRSLDGNATFDGVKVAGALGVGISATEDRRTGERSVAVRLGGEGARVLRVAGGGKAEGALDATLAIQHDARGRPVELAITVAGSGDLAVAFELPHGALEGTSDRAFEATTRLDLTLASNRERYLALRTALSGRDPGAVVIAAAKLARALAVSGRVDVARYETSSLGYGADGSLGMGGKAGVSAALDRSRKRLVGAWSKLPAGLWEQRADCVAAASAA